MSNVQLAPAPEGFMWVYNRLDRKYAQTFDGISEEFAPHQHRLLRQSAAEFLAERSCVKEDPFDPSNNLFALVAQGDPNFDVELSQEVLGIERLDRSGGDYVFRPTKDGIKTTAQATPVRKGLDPVREPSPAKPAITIA